MKNIVQRSITGVLLLGIIIGSITLNKYTFAACIGLLVTLSMFEFYSIMGKMGSKPQSYFGIVIGLIFFTISFLFASNIVSSKYYLAVFPLIMGIFIAELYRKKERPFQNIAITIVGIAYVAIPFSLFNFIAFNHFNNYQFAFGLILALFAYNWTNDTGAYLFGITLGKHRLFERISPKKSWEGAIGGALSVVGISFLFARLMPYISLTNWIILGLIVCLFGVFGDLIESLLKRSAEVKDSGTLLPGHGGFLDRFDAVLFSIPPFFCYLILIQ